MFIVHLAKLKFTFIARSEIMTTTTSGSPGKKGSPNKALKPFNTGDIKILLLEGIH